MKRIEKEKLKAAIIEASKDHLYLIDIAKTEKDFEYADFEEGENG